MKKDTYTWRTSYLITPNGGGCIACETLQCPSKIWSASFNISGRHARDTDTGPLHNYYIPARTTPQNLQSGGGSPTSQGPHWSFVNCLSTCWWRTRKDYIYSSYKSKRWRMILDCPRQTLQSYYMTYLALDWLRAEILDCWKSSMDAWDIGAQALRLTDGYCMSYNVLW